MKIKKAVMLTGITAFLINIFSHLHNYIINDKLYLF